MASDRYWGGWIETASREKIRALQDRKVNEQTRWVYRNSPFWQEKFESGGTTPVDVDGVEGLSDAPFGRKTEIRSAQRDEPPYGGLLCRPAQEIHDEGGVVWETSGTTGAPVKFLASQAEYKRVDVESACQILWTAGVRPGDTIALFWPLNLWIAGRGIRDAAFRMGISLLPLGGSYSTTHRLEKLDEYRPEVLLTTPTYALRLASTAVEEGIEPDALGAERLVVSGEPLTEETRDRLEELWGIPGRVLDYYGISELGACRCIECEEQDGIHVLEDKFLCQVVDPDGTEPVPDGEQGELVITALEQRDIATGYHFRTGDIVSYTDEPCACGRTSRRIEILSRTDDMVTIKGVNVFPSAVESAIRATEELNDEFRLRLETEDELDTVTVVVEPAPDLEAAEYDRVRQDLERELERVFGGLSIPVEFVDPGELERFDLKADRWVDER